MFIVVELMVIGNLAKSALLIFHTIFLQSNSRREKKSLNGSESAYFNTIIRFGRNIALFQWTLWSTLFPSYFLPYKLSNHCLGLVASFGSDSC